MRKQGGRREAAAPAARAGRCIVWPRTGSGCSTAARPRAACEDPVAGVSVISSHSFAVLMFSFAEYLATEEP